MNGTIPPFKESAFGGNKMEEDAIGRTGNKTLDDDFVVYIYSEVSIRISGILLQFSWRKIRR